MFRYNLYIALLQIRRHWLMTALLVLAIGLGVGASMTMLTIIHVLSRDPLPTRSASLFYVQMDSRPADWSRDGPDPNLNLSWFDASNLLAAGHASRKAAMAGGDALVSMSDSDALPQQASGHYVTSDFFAMFGVPFTAGHGWGLREDTGAAHVAVIGKALSQTLFGNSSSVGKTIRLQDTDFTVIGVIDHWAPRPLFYDDMGARAFGDQDEFFIPLHAALDLKFDTSSNVVCWGDKSVSERNSDHCTWLQFWVQLTADQVQPYRQFLFNYRQQQRDAGRLATKGNARLYPLMGWLEQQNLVPRDVWMQFTLAVCFFVVCIVNIVSLLFTKFMGRAREISIRRSLGAKRKDVFFLFTIEAAFIGSTGGGLGIVLVQLGLAIVRSRSDDYAALAHIDLLMLLLILLFAVLGSVLAGVIPTWRASSIAPALHLKGS